MRQDGSMTTPLAGISLALTSQWARLSRWLAPLGDDVARVEALPSSLPDWSVGDLIAHLGRGMSVMADVEPLTDGTPPMTMAEYLGNYQARAHAIAAETRELAEQMSGSTLPRVTTMAAAALAHLAVLGPDDDVVVGARRGPVTVRDLAATRLIELVVHTDDLVRSLDGVLDARGPNDPIDPTAARIVADELCDIVATRGGGTLIARKPLAWIRLATGRTPYNVDDLALAVETPYTAGGVPDLGRMLPLL